MCVCLQLLLCGSFTIYSMYWYSSNDLSEVYWPMKWSCVYYLLISIGLLTWYVTYCSTWKLQCSDSLMCVSDCCDSRWLFSLSLYSIDDCYFAVSVHCIRVCAYFADCSLFDNGILIISVHLSAWHCAIDSLRAVNGWNAASFWPISEKWLASGYSYILWPGCVAIVCVLQCVW